MKYVVPGSSMDVVVNDSDSEPLSCRLQMTRLEK